MYSSIIYIVLRFGHTHIHLRIIRMKRRAFQSAMSKSHCPIQLFFRASTSVAAAAVAFNRSASIPNRLIALANNYQKTHKFLSFCFCWYSLAWISVDFKFKYTSPFRGQINSKVEHSVYKVRNKWWWETELRPGECKLCSEHRIDRIIDGIIRVYFQFITFLFW